MKTLLVVLFALFVTFAPISWAIWDTYGQEEEPPPEPICYVKYVNGRAILVCW